VTKHVVGFSGGIDSQAAAAVVLDEFGPADVILMNSDAGGNEHPMTTEFVHWYSANVHPVVMVQAIVADLGDVGTKEGFDPKRRRETLNESDPLTFDRLAFVKGRFPSRRAQFCTEYLKLSPQKRWLTENLLAHGIDFIRYAGVRADESEMRKNLPQRQWDDYYDCELVRPVLTWTKDQCFEFVKARGERINPLYTLGFGRVGCAPCVNSSKEDIREWAARFPEMIDKVRAWEASVGRTFFPPTVTGKKGKSKEDPTLINWIDEVVEWAKTTRGGKQYALPLVEADADAGTCSSKYGLCE
jgi:3'-phosphoadenosine 5'-phosphosulfate sulfotransferase (PAPS reductase)/FAD synthetase